MIKLLFLQTFFLSFFPFIILMIFIGCRWLSFRSKTKKSLPPSPWKLPIIGNFHQLGSNPHRSLHSLSLKHGPLMLIHLGNVPVLVASSAKAAMEIMKFHDLSISGRPRLMMTNILLYGCKDIAFSPYGEYWRQLKSIVICHLLSNKQVKSFRRVREEEIGVTIGMLAESCGSTVDLGGLIVSLANKITCRVAFGRTYDHHGSKFTSLLIRFMNMLGVFCVGDYIPWLSWVDRLKNLEGNAKKIATEFDDFLDCVLKEHRSKKKGEDAKSDKDQDLVDILLDVQKNETTGFTLGDDTLKGVILDMFSAGTDTTYTSLEWAVSELIKHPSVMKKLQQEATIIAQGRSTILEEDLEKMQYLKAVIKESLRLHATVPFLPRETTEDVKLMGYDIPVGTQLLVNAWAIGRDPTVWEDSNKFMPERFLKDNSTSTYYQSTHYDWLPFGAGRRGCPGIQFGTTIMELALANMVHKFDFALPNGVKNEDIDMSETYGITVHKKSSLMVVASQRF